MLETNEQTNRWAKKESGPIILDRLLTGNLVTGTKYSGISQILATNHKNIKISEMTLSCSKLMRLNETRNFRKVEIIIENHQVHDDDRRIGQMRQKHSVIKLS
jgi:hypothetical protein